jgi:hypothetical protein
LAKHKKDSSFSEEKEAKRLLFVGDKPSNQRRAALKSLFCFFFLQKKEDSFRRLPSETRSAESAGGDF